MNRRRFLSFAMVAPIAAVPMAAAPSNSSVMKPLGRRMSCVAGDAGYFDFCKATGDRMRVRAFLDGVEQKYATVADERLGMIVRQVTTERGNIAHDGLGNILEETVYGDVQIFVEEPKSA